MTGAELYKPGICASVLGVFLRSKGADEAVGWGSFPTLCHSSTLASFVLLLKQLYSDLGDVFVNQQSLSSSYSCKAMHHCKHYLNTVSYGVDLV